MNRLRHKRHSKNFAALIGAQFMASCGDRASGRKRREDLTQGFFALLLERRDLNAVRKEKGRFVLICLGRSKHFLATNGAVRWRLNAAKASARSRWKDLRERSGRRIRADGSGDCRANLRAPLGIDSWIKC